MQKLKSYYFCFFTFLLLCLGFPAYTFSQILPTSIPGLSLWLSSDSGVTLNAGMVSQWNDLSGNNHPAIQGVPSRQPLYTTPVSLLNDKPVIRFDGANDFLQTAASYTTGEVFMIMNWNDPAAIVYPDYNGALSCDGAKPYLIIGDVGQPNLYSAGGNLFGSNIFIN